MTTDWCSDYEEHLDTLLLSGHQFCNLVHYCRDGPNSTKNPWGAGGRLTHTTWQSIGLPTYASVPGGGYTAKDVFTQQQLFVNESGFTANISGYNATLVLVQASEAV